MDLAGNYRRAPVTVVLAAVLIGVFAAQPLLPVSGSLALSHEALARGMWWTLITHIFLHANLFHLAVNVLGLWFIGPEVEMTLGRVRFLVLFIASGVAGGVLQMAFTPASADQEMIGASGAVCGLLLSFATAYPRVILRALIFFIIPVTAKARTLGIGLIVFSVVCALLRIAPNIGHLSHLGGALTGSILTWFWRPVRATHAPISHEALLDKVADEGLEGLTPQERKYFEVLMARHASRRR